MTITVLQENLLPKIQEATRFIASKPQLPILSGVYLSCEDKNLLIRSTDLKVGFQTAIGGKVEKEGSCVVPSRFFVEFLSSLRAGPVTLSVSGQELTISQGKVRSTLSTFPIIDFPPFPSTGELMTKLPVQQFSQAIEQVFYAASLDETRPVIASILLKFEDSRCTVAATDGYRLAVKSIEEVQCEKQQIVLIQAKMLSEIARIIGKRSAAEVSLFVSMELAQASFQVDDTMMMVRMTEGTFPNFQAIIPPNFQITTQIERDSLIHGIKTALVIAKESSSIISIEISDKLIRVLGSSQSVGKNVTEIESSYSGETITTIACNAKFLLDCLTRIEAEYIELSINEELKPIRLRSKDDKKFTYIVMPFKK